MRLAGQLTLHRTAVTCSTAESGPVQNLVCWHTLGIPKRDRSPVDECSWGPRPASIQTHDNSFLWNSTCRSGEDWKSEVCTRCIWLNQQEHWAVPCQAQSMLDTQYSTSQCTCLEVASCHTHCIYSYYLLLWWRKREWNLFEPILVCALIVTWYGMNDFNGTWMANRTIDF